MPLKARASGCTSLSCLLRPDLLTVDFGGLRELGHACGVSYFCFLKMAAAETVAVFLGGLVRFGGLKASRLGNCVTEIVFLTSIADVGLT